MIKRIVTMTFQKDKIADFQAIFRESKYKIRHFKGCRHLELLRCTNPDNVFFTFSFWEDETHLNAYRHSELFQSTWSRTKVLFAQKPEAWSTEAET